MKYSLNTLVMAMAMLGLVACGGSRHKVHTVDPSEVASPDASQSVGRYKIGKPYQVRGRWYYPKLDYDYVETGIASWYGPGFHGKHTANGEIYDQTDLTAAHRTLPMPSMVRVTNLDNGRSLVVRVNDRGPFANDRIIDLSKNSASLLGFLRQGTARVRVEILEDESRRLAAIAQNRELASSTTAVPVESVTAVPLSEGDAAVEAAPASSTQIASRPASVEPEPDGVVTQGRAVSTSIYVQAGSFVDYQNASRLKNRLAQLGPALVVPGWVGAQRYYRVRMGPLANVEEADRYVELLTGDGVNQPQIILE